MCCKVLKHRLSTYVRRHKPAQDIETRGRCLIAGLDMCAVQVSHGFQQFFISRRCLVARELNAPLYNSASLQYQIPDTILDTTPSHIILGGPVLALPQKSECQGCSLN